MFESGRVPLPELNVRSSALTMPAVSVPSSWNGLPMASTESPTRRAVESPIGAGFAYWPEL